MKYNLPMSKLKIIFILSILVTILSYLGFPSYLKNILYSVFGLGIAVLAYVLYKDIKVKEVKEKTFDNFSENSNFDETEKETQEENVNENLEG